MDEPCSALNPAATERIVIVAHNTQATRASDEPAYFLFREADRNGSYRKNLHDTFLLGNRRLHPEDSAKKAGN